MTANFLSVPLPTGVDGIPTDIDAQVNTPLSLNPQILPQGWSLQGYQPREFFEGVADFAPKYDWWKDGLNLTPEIAGDYEAAYVAEIDTIIIAKYVTFHVSAKSD